MHIPEVRIFTLKAFGQGVQIVNGNAVFIHNRLCHLIVSYLISKDASRFPLRNKSSRSPDKLRPRLFQPRDDGFEVLFVLLYGHRYRSVFLIAIPLHFRVGMSGSTKVMQPMIEVNDIPLCFTKVFILSFYTPRFVSPALPLIRLTFATPFIMSMT